LNAIPHIGRLLEAEVDTLLGWADHLVIAQKPGEALARRLSDSGLPVLDLVGSSMAATGAVSPV